MKPEELMIGDWVIRRGVPEEPMWLSDMKTIAGIAYLDQDGRGVAEKFENIEPIPITEEILKKNGFKNDVIAQKAIIAEGASNFSVILISEDNRIILNNIDEYLNSFNKWHVHIDTEDMRTICTSEITYVHELQHLLKLCKIEKEIVL